MGPQAQLQGHGKNTGGIPYREVVARRIQKEIDSVSNAKNSPKFSVEALKGCQRALRHLDAVPDFNGCGRIATHMRSAAVIQRIIKYGSTGSMPARDGENSDDWLKLRNIYIQTDADLIAAFSLIEGAYFKRPSQTPQERYEKLVDKICDAGHVPTPRDTADLMAELGGVDPGERVLVPCGGIGPLVQAAVDRGDEDEPVTVHCIEIEHGRHAAMSLRFSGCPSVRLYRENFLQWRNDGDLFDAVLICPPGTDVNENVLRAFRSVRAPIEEVGKPKSEWITGGLVALLEGVPSDHDRLFRDLQDRGAGEINTTLMGGKQFLLDAWRDS